MNKRIKYGFSLVEVMISLLILSIIMVALAPVITKKVLSKKRDGIVYAYLPDNKTKEANACFVTNTDGTYTSTSNCSEYKFKVPKGVTRINLTLVAGGGGGGGAGGGGMKFPQYFTGETGNTETTKDLTTSSMFFPDLVKEVKINFLTAKGQTGGAINTGCDANSVACGGKGGASSPAIGDFTLSEKYMLGNNFQSNLTGSTKGHILLSSLNNAASAAIVWGDVSSNSSRTVKYEMGSDYKAKCYIGSASATSTSDSADFYDICQIPKISLLPSAEGEYGAGLSSSDSVYSGYDLPGGKGGKISYTPPKDSMIAGAYAATVEQVTNTDYGKGGDGAWLGFSCSNKFQACSVSSAGKSTGTAAKEGGMSYASVSYKVIFPGATGGGGGGGTVIKITGFPVNPDEEYIVRVGKGGFGGNTGVSSTSPTDGETGEGGVSTGIFDSNNNLIYMVTGGAGGSGGNAGSTDSESETKSGISASNRIYPKVFTGDAGYFENVKTDITKFSLSSPKDNVLPTGAASAKSITYLNLQKEPYKTLNLSGLTADDNKTGGFSDFDTGSVTNQDINFNGSNVSGVYDGLYHGILIKNRLAYIGGLGGFTGFGGKAGCGGYFMGNFDGRKSDGSNDSGLVNKFIADLKPYGIFEYYDNCNIQTPNGQSANFVLPDPVSSSYGQAGAGGGGGGYSTNQGPGKGGDGQDGYLMIDWRR